MIKHFWLLLSLACIGWYLVVLGYVIVKGGADIKHMLKRLSGNQLPKTNENDLPN